MFAESSIEIQHPCIYGNLGIELCLSLDCIVFGRPEDFCGSRCRPTRPNLVAIRCKGSFLAVPIWGVTTQGQQKVQPYANSVQGYDAFFDRFDRNINAKTVGELLCRGQAETLGHGTIALPGDPMRRAGSGSSRHRSYLPV